MFKNISYYYCYSLLDYRDSVLCPYKIIKFYITVHPGGAETVPFGTSQLWGLLVHGPPSLGTHPPNAQSAPPSPWLCTCDMVGHGFLQQKSSFLGTWTWNPELAHNSPPQGQWGKPAVPAARGPEEGPQRGGWSRWEEAGTGMSRGKSPGDTRL